MPAMCRFLTVLATCLALALPAQAGERLFILVHGAWGTGAYWDPVAERLRAAGAKVEAVDLPLGEASITLSDQADAILAALDRHPGVVATLVAHSAGTRPATLAWDRARDRIAAAAFVEGVPPVPGAAPVAIPPDERSLRWLAQHAPDVLESGLLPPPADLDPAYAAVARAHPIRPLYGAVEIANGPLPAIPVLYVTAEDSPSPEFQKIASLVARLPNWTVRAIPGGHDVARDAPDALTDLLMNWPAN